jgi:hypothetical protein
VKDARPVLLSVEEMNLARERRPKALGVQNGLWIGLGIRPSDPTAN